MTTRHPTPGTPIRLCGPGLESEASMTWCRCGLTSSTLMTPSSNAWSTNEKRGNNRCRPGNEFKSFDQTRRLCSEPGFLAGDGPRDRRRPKRMVNVGPRSGTQRLEPGREDPQQGQRRSTRSEVDSSDLHCSEGICSFNDDGSRGRC